MISFFQDCLGVRAYFSEKADGDRKPDFIEPAAGGIANFDPPVIVRPVQVHKDRIAIIRDEDVRLAVPNREGQKQLVIPETDGLCTDCRNVMLTTVHADCLAVFLLDEAKRVIGLCHAGWRGTLSGIALNTASAMVAELGAEPDQISAAISPGISRCCFETGEEVYEAFREHYDYIDEYAYKKENGAYYIDLKGINHRQLHEFGIKKIEVSPLCTACETERFFSYRKEGGIPERMNAGICIFD